MERDHVIGSKGQISIEFLFIFMIALVYVAGVVEPSTRVGQAVVDDVTRVTQTRAAADTVANSVNELFLSDGQAKKTIRVLVPDNAVLDCDDATPSITFSVDLSPALITVPACPDKTCASEIPLANTNITCRAGGFQGKNIFTIELTRNAAGTVNVQ
jgi:hypothetical protein